MNGPLLVVSLLTLSMAKPTPVPPLTYAGRVSGAVIPATVNLEFVFRSDHTGDCAAIAVVASPQASTGAFEVTVPLSPCAADAMSTGAARYDVRLNGALADGNRAVSAVPVAHLAVHLGAPECPLGYRRLGSDAGELYVCSDGTDEVVRVGTGASSFWVDRYESLITELPDGGGRQVTCTPGSFPQFSSNGQTVPDVVGGFAFSRRGALASTCVTWFQANAACRAKGKRLPTAAEWLEAARGTADPGASNGAGGVCVTTGGARRGNGGGSSCQSMYGAQDLVGNAAEWTAEWFAAPGDGTGFNHGWPTADLGFDALTNISSTANHRDGGATPVLFRGLPSAAIRGGSANSGQGAGVFALALDHSPASYEADLGFRCVLPR